jgi:hypothetical protein
MTNCIFHWCIYFKVPLLVKIKFENKFLVLIEKIKKKLYFNLKKFYRLDGAFIIHNESEKWVCVCAHVLSYVTE